jgi:DNA-binding GntR family transcriptional regulator
MGRKNEAIARNSGLADQVARRIATGITKGDFLEGERLVEAKLAARYGVSRGPVREALQMLAHQGMVEIQAGKGAYVHAITADELEKMLVLRSTFEGLAARIVAASGTEAHLDKLETIAREMQAAREQGDMGSLRSLRANFHAALCEFAGYPVASNWWRSMHNLACIFHSQWELDALDADDAQKHEDDVRILREGNPEVAERRLRARVLCDGYKRLGREVPSALKDYLDCCDANASG